MSEDQSKIGIVKMKYNRISIAILSGVLLYGLLIFHAIVLNDGLSPKIIIIAFLLGALFSFVILRIFEEIGNKKPRREDRGSETKIEVD